MTPPKRRFLLDANVFIQAHRRHYGFDIAPGFWAALIKHHFAGLVFSLDRVKQEIEAGKDALKDWVMNIGPPSLFVPTDEPTVIDAFRDAQVWVNRQPQFLPAARAEFAKEADGWLPAYARVHGFVVVTQEEYNPDAKKRVPIPNVCRAFSVEYIDTFQMLRELGVVLSS